ncbi:hypothetical protein [Pseudomonas sp. GWSMS-1]|uniref:hypothetical protein n=1 Tax=Pseudomonas sp. GWSMS-1 TaxID=3308997 RepID=UPI003CE676AF
MQYQICRSWTPRRTLLSLAVAGLLPGFAQAEEPLELKSDEVVATTPLPGIDLPKDRVPANIQTLDDERLRKLGGQSLAENCSAVCRASTSTRPRATPIRQT